MWGTVLWGWGRAVIFVMRLVILQFHPWNIRFLNSERTVVVLRQASFIIFFWQVNQCFPVLWKNKDPIAPNLLGISKAFVGQLSLLGAFVPSCTEKIKKQEELWGWPIKEVVWGERRDNKYPRRFAKEETVRHTRAAYLYFVLKWTPLSFPACTQALWKSVGLTDLHSRLWALTGVSMVKSCCLCKSSTDGAAVLEATSWGMRMTEAAIFLGPVCHWGGTMVAPVVQFLTWLWLVRSLGVSQSGQCLPCNELATYICFLTAQEEASSPNSLNLLYTFWKL